MNATDSSQVSPSSRGPQSSQAPQSSHGGSAPGTGPGSGSDAGSGSGTGTGTGSGSQRHLNSSVCAFWVSERCYAIETSLVGEVVNIEQVTPVPMAPPAILGLFNLRGMPVALIDLAQVLELPSGSARASESRVALVLRGKSGPLAAALIDRMEMVVPPGGGVFTPRSANEHPAVHGFLSVDVRGGLVLTLVDSAALMQRLERLKSRS